MNVLDHLRKIYNSFFNIPNIPWDLKDINEPIALHISDTPVSYHSFIYRVLEELKPDYLIHTGDLVDNIKMEFNPQLKDAYDTRVFSFIKHLEALPLEDIFLVIGNHDDLEIIKNYSKKIKIIEEGSTITLGNTKVNLAHHPWNLRGEGKYNLFGHNFKEIPQFNGQILLNGLNKMHVILLNSDRVVSIDYPYGINQDRKMHSRNF